MASVWWKVCSFPDIYCTINGMTFGVTRHVTGSTGDKEIACAIVWTHAPPTGFWFNHLLTVVIHGIGQITHQYLNLYFANVHQNCLQLDIQTMDIFAKCVLYRCSYQKTLLRSLLMITFWLSPVLCSHATWNRFNLKMWGSASENKSRT